MYHIVLYIISTARSLEEAKVRNTGFSSHPSYLIYIQVRDAEKVHSLTTAYDRASNNTIENIK
jgi:hypothetical protein